MKNMSLTAEAIQKMQFDLNDNAVIAPRGRAIAWDSHPLVTGIALVNRNIRQSGVIIIALLCLISAIKFIMPASESAVDRMGRTVSPIPFESAAEKGSAVIGEALYNDSIPVITVAVSSSWELMRQLKRFKLWDIPDKLKVPPIAFTCYPDNIDQLDIELKKKAFLHALLPTAMIAQSEIQEERNALISLLNRLGDVQPDLIFAEEHTYWRDKLTDQELQFFAKLTNKYRTTQIAELLTRVEVVPVSLIMAQGALESSWGGSRFAADGNNLFGIWTWGGNGMVPEEREDDKNHKVAVYDNILGSVRDYILTLNRLPAYTHFRRIRQMTMDSVDLAEGLLQYSERRSDYVSEVRQIIKYNDLQRYDNYVLSSIDSIPNNNQISLTSLGQENNTSL